MEKDNTYIFEKKSRKRSRSKKEAQTELAKFANRLDLKESHYTGHKDELLEYVMEHHLNIDWYEERLKKERNYRYIFTTISLALLLLIPIGILYLTQLPGISGSSVAAQITAVLTGLLAVHRSLSSWFSKRQLMGHFWKASADLKESLYSFEERWRGNAVTENNKLKDDFVKGVYNGIDYARKIVKEEKINFFKLHSLPSIDLGRTLKEATADAKSLFTTHISPDLEREQARETLEMNILKLEKEINGLDILINEKKELLNKSSVSEMPFLKSRIETLETELDTRKLQLYKEKAELTTLS
ncbi:MAG: hypothetical protein KAU83_05160 [Bacteroidales bacterium]|nr:hypothetical protein [Bacteroidales bacterium]